MKVITSPLQPEQRLQPEIPNEDESRSWTVSPSDRLVFRTKADAAGGEMETTLTVANRCHLVASCDLSNFLRLTTLFDLAHDVSL